MNQIEALRADLQALREILLNLLYRQLTGASITPPEMAQLIADSDENKMGQAMTRIDKCDRLMDDRY